VIQDSSRQFLDWGVATATGLRATYRDYSGATFRGAEPFKSGRRFPMTGCPKFLDRYAREDANTQTEFLEFCEPAHSLIPAGTGSAVSRILSGYDNRGKDADYLLCATSVCDEENKRACRCGGLRLFRCQVTRLPSPDGPRIVMASWDRPRASGRDLFKGIDRPR
jgi:hypothetical protein